MSNIEKIRQEIIKMRELAAISAVGNHTDWLESRIATCGDILAFIDSLPEEKPSEDLEEAAQDYAILPMDVGDGRVCIDKKEERAFIAGAEWQAKQLLKGSPLPEDTVLFQKGVEEGRRLEKDDLALSIDDIEKIHVFLYAIKNNKQGAFTFTRLSDEQYKEVLRRFKEVQK